MHAIFYKNNIFVTIDSILNREVILELVGICDIVVHLAAAETNFVVQPKNTNCITKCPETGAVQ